MPRLPLVALLASLTSATAALAQLVPFPASFRTQDITTNGATIHVRVGGSGPAVVLLHGFGDTGDMWAPLATELAHDHTVIVPDLRGMGLSSHASDGYHKKTEARDIIGVMDSLHIDKAAVVGHDIGNMVAFALTSRFPTRVTRLVLMEAPIPGLLGWEEQSHQAQTWHFYFYGPNEERLVAGRERIYLDRFYDDFAATPSKIDEQTRAHYAQLYALPGAMHSAFSQFAAFPRDASDNEEIMKGGKLSTPVLAIGGEHSYGSKMAMIARSAFVHVDEVVIANAGHWLMEEQPTAVIAAVVPFIQGKPAMVASSVPHDPKVSRFP